MKRGKNVEQQRSSCDTDFQAGIEVGYLCRKLEEDLNAVAAAAGGRVTARGLAEGVGNLLLAKACGQLLDDTQRMPEVRRGSSRGDEEPAPAAKVHVRPRRVGAPVTCRECNTRCVNRSAYMKHRIRKHPEAVEKQREALRRAVQERRAA